MTKPRDKEETSRLQYETEHTSPAQHHSVFIYLAILAAVAFLLLLMAYFMQQRTNETALNSLQQTSNSAVESLEGLIDERDKLQEQTAALEGQVERLTAQQAELERQLAEAEQARQDADAAKQDALDATQRLVDALNKLNRLRALYNDRRYTEAKAMLADQEAVQEWEALLTRISESLTDAEREVYDPLEAFRDLTDRLS